MWGWGRTSSPVPALSMVGPNWSKKTKGPTMRRAATGRTRWTSKPSPRSLLRGSTIISIGEACAGLGWGGGSFISNLLLTSGGGAPPWLFSAAGTGGARAIRRRSAARPAGGGIMPLETPPGYRALSESTLPEYLSGLPGIAERLGGRPDEWKTAEVGDGNLN